jgi:hypothetical protein
MVAGLTIINGYGPEEELDFGEPWGPISVGGAILCRSASPTIAFCSFRGNSAVEGGAIFSWLDAGPLITNCTVAGCRSMAGGGLACIGNTTVANCAILGNHADFIGGGIVCAYSSGAVITNCTIANNTATGLGPYSGGGIFTQSDDLLITNCILWGNRPNQLLEDSASTTVAFSDVQGSWPGEGNIDSDPRFADPTGPDGDPDTWRDNDYHLSFDSPCKNAGDPNGNYTGQLDIDGESRQMGDRVDMGADEWTYYTCGEGVETMLPALALLALTTGCTSYRTRRIKGARRG